MIFVLTGNGKGKTTCAIGMGIRAAGAGKKVLMIQFLKPAGCGEEKIIAKLKNFSLMAFGRSGFILPQKEIEKCLERKKGKVKPVSKEDFNLAARGFKFSREKVENKECDFLILDEINLALKFGLLNKKEIINFLQDYGKKIDIVLTGRDASKDLVEIADLVTEMKEKKHYYQKAVPARKGIEY